MSFFQNFFNIYNSFGLIIIIIIIIFTLKLKYDNGQNNSNSKHNYNALLAIESIFGLIIIYKLFYLSSTQKINSGLSELIKI